MATSGLSVLLVGETGVGKELVAREIHRIGQRSGDRTGPFVIIDCASLSATNTGDQLESEFRLAESGTVFFAGIDELSRALQAQLLRILDDQEIVQVSASSSMPVDVRIIAAAPGRTAGELRADLYYRVCECLIEIPPLRARGSDIRLLADHFLAKLRTAQQLSAPAYQALERCVWPGNIRELEAVIRRAALLHADCSILGPECLFDRPPTDGRADGRADRELGSLLDCSWDQAKEEFARWYWTTVWHAFAGDRRRIAEHARVSDVWLRSRRKIYELHDDMSGPDGESGAESSS